MPSYRAVVEILDLVPGHAPEEVMAAAVAAVRRTTTIEDRRLDVVQGVPTISVRFTVPASADVEERTIGYGVVDDVAAAVSQVARIRHPHLAKRSPRGRWLAIDRP